MDALSETLINGLTGQAELQIDVIAFAISMIIAIVAGLLLKNLYLYYYNSNEPLDGSLARSLVLLTPSLAATFWMIQSSLMLTFGLLGSLSFVRFRTPVKRPEDIAFIVISIAIAISCATNAYLITTTLLFILGGYVVIRRKMGPGFVRPGKTAILTFNSREVTSSAQLKEAIGDLKLSGEFVSSRIYDGISSFVFQMSGLDNEGHDALSNSLRDLDPSAQLNIFYPDEKLGA